MQNNVLAVRNIIFLCIFLYAFKSYSIASHEKAIAIYEKNMISLFRSIDFNGNIFFIRNISGFNTSKSYIHLHVKFNSSSTNYSPYVGYGWSVPFFESVIYPFSDDLYVLNMPDGYVKIFIRDKKNPNLLFSRGGWRAVIKKDTITAYSEEQILRYKSGCLVNLKTKDYNLNFQYNSRGLLKEIRERGITILQVQRNGLITTIKTLHSNPIVLSTSKRYVPRLKKNVFSLSYIKYFDNELNYKYSFDKNRNPQLKTEYCTLTWDAKTNFAIKINDYFYKIKPSPTNIICSAAITEHLPKYNRPDTFWQKNDSSGIEIYDAYGVKNITSRFVSGMFRGRTRKKEQFYQGKLIEKNEFSYNEKGKINRILGLKNDWLYIYEKDGVTLAAKILNGKIYKEYTPNAKRLTRPYLNKYKRDNKNKGILNL